MRREILSWCIYGHIFDISDQIRCMNISAVMTTHSVNFSWIGFFLPCLHLKSVYRKLASVAKHCNATTQLGIYVEFTILSIVCTVDDELSAVIILYICMYVCCIPFLSLQQILPDTQKQNDEITFTSFTGIMFVKIANKTISLFSAGILKVFFYSSFCFFFVIEFTFQFIRSKRRFIPD